MIKNLTNVKALVLMCLLFCVFGAQAQTAKDTSGRDDRPSFKVGLSYTNNQLFLGRSDTVKTPTIIPLIKYIFESGVFISADLNYVTNRKNNKLDGGSLSLGYNFDISDNMEGGVSFSKSFYNSNSTQVNSSNRANFNGNLSYNLLDIITSAVNIDYDLNRNGVGNDVFINFGLSHDVEFDGLFSDNDNLTISPSAELNSGTQNFYDDYIVVRATKNKRITTIQSSLLASQKAELSQFKLLDYEFALPVEYQAGHLIVNFTPAMAFAQNKLPANISSNLSSSSSLFYFHAGITLKF